MCVLGWGMHECVCVQDFMQDFGRGVTPKFGVDVKGVYSTQQLGVWGHAPPVCLFFN